MLAIVAVLCITGTAAKAEGFVVKGGFNYSNFNPDDIGGYNAWFAGIGYQTYSWNGFSLQPELLYRVNGAKFGDALGAKFPVPSVCPHSRPGEDMRPQPSGQPFRWSGGGEPGGGKTAECFRGLFVCF